MESKVLFVFCVHAYLAQLIAGQCLGNALNNVHGINGLGFGGLSGPGLGFAANGRFAGNSVETPGLSLNNIAANSNAGGLMVTSASPIAPRGLSVMSEYAIEGPVVVTGELPFMSAVSVEGPVSTGGQASVGYASGNGNVGMVSEGLGANAAGIGVPSAGWGGELSLGNGLARGFVAGVNRGIGNGAI